MTLQEFYDKYVNQKGVGNTPENKGQCVGLSSLWMDNFGIPHVFGNADDLYTNAPDAYFIKIPNTPDAIPLDGDIMIWGFNYNHSYGHTGVAKGKHDVNGFECFEQNDPLGSTPHIKKYNYAYVTGWLRPKAFHPEAPTEDIDSIRKRRDDLWNLLTKITKELNVPIVDDLVNDFTVIKADIDRRKADYDNVDKINGKLLDEVDSLQNKIDDLKTDLEKCENKPTTIVTTTSSSTPSSTVTIPYTTPVSPVDQAQTDFFTGLYQWIKSFFKKL